MKDQKQRAVAFALATVGNAGVGFDILGFSVDAVGDRVEVRRGAPGVRIADITGVVTDLPRNPEENSVTAGILRLAEDRDLTFGFDVLIHKGISIGSGMGGSAASGVAGIVAANHLLSEPLSKREMLQYALAGEAVASGSPHADNAAPCLYGGLTLVRDNGNDVLPIPVPDGLICVLVHPDHRVDTRRARDVLPQELPLSTIVEQSGYLASFIAGCYLGDPGRVAASCRDVMVEPFRSRLIPGFDLVKDAAYDAGALAFSISGSGPSVFALVSDERSAAAVRGAIVEAFGAAGLSAESWTSPISAVGARVVEER